MISNNIDFNSPLRKIKGKAELYNSSAIAASGTVITARNVCPKTHDVKVSVASKNILDANNLFAQQEVKELVIGDNSFTGRGGVGDAAYAWNAGQLMFPYINATNITNKGFLLEAGTTYTVSFNASIQEVGVYGNKITVIIYRLNDAGNTTVEYQLYGLTITLDTNNRYSFSFTATKNTKYGLCFRINNNYITISNIQVEQAADDTPFTPYIADISTVGVKRYGKNLFNPALVLPNGAKTSCGITFEYLADEDCFLLNGTMDRTSSQNILTTNLNMLGNIGAKYKVSTRYMGGTVTIGSNNTTYPVAYFAKSANTTSMTNWVNSRMTNEDFLSATTVVLDTNYIRAFWFYIRPGDSFDNYKVRIQLEESAVATEYEPFKQPVEVVNGTVKSLSPLFTLIPSAPGVKLTAEFNGIQKLAEYSYQDSLKDMTIDRTGENGKFFGFGVCQKLTVNLRDKERSITTSPASAFIPYLGIGEGEYTRSTFPMFYVDETKRDENTNDLSITAYDTIKLMEQHTIGNINLSSYTIKQLLDAIASYFCLTLKIQGVMDLSCFDTEYPEGANLEGTETIREVLNYIAEVTQTIYYMDGSTLIFKRLSAETALTIPKTGYMTLESKDSRRLSAITSATELGDNYTSTLDTTGVTQYVRDNPFWELREDVAELVEDAVAAVGGLTITEFNCSWRGNYYLEIGDKIEIIGKDDQPVSSYVINDSIKYTGGLSQETQWSYEENNDETSGNSTNLGEVLKQTYAKVDKANKQIEILASETSTNSSEISQLKLDTQSILASVSQAEKDMEDINTELKRQADLLITPEDVTITIQEEMSKGTDKVITSTGYKFDDEGLNVSKSNSDISTKITHNGMTVSQGGTEMLAADKDGVKAADLHATTYLIIGKNSRFEDYGTNRTACFWIGG